MGHVPTPTSSQDHVLTDADRERIADRYPKQCRTPWVILILVLAAVLVGWTVWAGLHHAEQPIRASLHGYQAISDTRVNVTTCIGPTPPSRVPASWSPPVLTTCASGRRR